MLSWAEFINMGSPVQILGSMCQLEHLGVALIWFDCDQNLNPKAIYTKWRWKTKTFLICCKRGYPKIQRIWNTEWIYPVSSAHLPLKHVVWESPEDTSFTKVVGDTLVRGASASLKTSVVLILCGLGIVDLPTSELGFLIHGYAGKDWQRPGWVIESTRIKVGVVIIMGNKRK